MPEQTNQSDRKTSLDIMHDVMEKLPPDFAEMNSELQLHHVVKAANETLNVPGDWVLVNGNMTLIELLKDASES